MKKIIFGCLLLGSCMAGNGDFQSSGLLVRLLGLLESVGANSIETLTLSGYLKDENGNPIANATMGVEDNSSASIKQTLTTSTKTDSDGRYTLTLKVGSFTIRVTDSSGGSLGTFSILASSTTIDPVISVSEGNFVVTVSALNNGITSSPSALSYTGSPYTFTKDNSISNKTPTFSGNITSCKSTPTLPTGLNLSSTCEITGTPTVSQIASSYHIVGSNSFGNASTIIVITVNQLAPSSFGYFNNVVSLTQNIQMSSLQTYYTGTITSCSSAPPLPAGLQMDPSSCIVYGTPISTQNSTLHTITASNSVGSTTANLLITINLQPPSSLSYSGSPFTFTAGLPISSRIPTYSNSISTCSSNPGLPSGLSLSSVCTITGTPSSVQVARSYTITASNSGGSTQTSIVITINPQAPASLSYSGSPFTFTRNVAITTRTPTVTGTISNCTISPALPTGLGINSTTCAISGSPTVTQTATTHTITASNLGGSTTTSITITVNLAAPTSLSYAGSPYTFTQNVAISSQTPTVTGTISTCTISPNLPSGLGINGTTCVISGTPTVVQTASIYTVTASNSGGSTTATISIAVNIAPPSSLSYSGSPYTFTQNVAISPRTPTFSGSVNSCTTNPALPTGLGINGTTCVISGTPTVVQSATNYTVTATNSSGSTTASISITVNIAPPSSLSYTGSPYTFTQNTAISARTPTFSGSVNTCTTNPALPTGLGINGTTCVISGTPTVVQTATNYTVTATNSSGSTTASISITVNIAPPSSLSYSGSPFTFTQNVAISAQTPTFSGSVTTCTSNPTLPSGLGINGTTCLISGTPTVLQSSTSYTITASNSSGSTTVTISIAVNIAPPSSLSYSGSPFTLLQGLTINSQTPSITGTISSCSISPALQSGLLLSNTCVLSGTPSAILSSTNYTVTATNASGSTTASISISVDSPNNYIVSMPSGLLKTGQTTSYTTGDDGTYQKGVARTFTMGGTSGLIWQRCDAGQNNDSTCSGTAKDYIFNDANTYCNSLKIGGITWRLPDIQELNNLLNYGVHPNNQVIPRFMYDSYWSSTINISNSSNAWLMRNYGIISYESIQIKRYVKCITGSSQSLLTYNVSGNQVISSNGLIWQKCAIGQDLNTCSNNPTLYKWLDAISQCEALNLNNRTDWRLPNINELRSLINYNKVTSPVIDSKFLNTQSAYYWSSTSNILNLAGAFGVNFLDGRHDYLVGSAAFDNKSIVEAYVRCVAGP
jgi:hypothetical protein